MKRVAWTALVCVLVGILTFWGNRFVDSTLDYVQHSMESALELSQAGEYEKADGIYRRLMEEWDTREKRLGLMMKHDILSEISGMIRETSAFNDPDHQTELKSETVRTLDRVRTARALFFSAY